jgi:hypothetical protein
MKLDLVKLFGPPEPVAPTRRFVVGTDEVTQHDYGGYSIWKMSAGDKNCPWWKRLELEDWEKEVNMGDPIDGVDGSWATWLLPWEE